MDNSGEEMGLLPSSCVPKTQTKKPFDENGCYYELRNMFCYEMGEDMEHLPSLILLPSSMGLGLPSIGLLMELVFLVMSLLMDGIATLVAIVGVEPRELNLG